SGAEAVRADIAFRPAGAITVRSAKNPAIQVVLVLRDFETPDFSYVDSPLLLQFPRRDEDKWSVNSILCWPEQSVSEYEATVAQIDQTDCGLDISKMTLNNWKGVAYREARGNHMKEHQEWRRKLSDGFFAVVGGEASLVWAPSGTENYITLAS